MFYRSRIKFGMTAWMAVLRWGGVFFATKRIRPLSQSKGACLQRDVGTSTGSVTVLRQTSLFAKKHRPSRAHLTLRCGCRDRVAVHVVCLATVCHPTSVTLSLTQGLYKFWLNVLQIPNQVRDDGLDGGSRWGGVFFATKRIRPLGQSKGACMQRSVGPSTGSGTTLREPQGPLSP